MLKTIQICCLSFSPPFLPASLKLECECAGYISLNGTRQTTILPSGNILALIYQHKWGVFFADCFGTFCMCQKRAFTLVFVTIKIRLILQLKYNYSCDAVWSATKTRFKWQKTDGDTRCMVSSIFYYHTLLYRKQLIQVTLMKMKTKNCYCQQTTHHNAAVPLFPCRCVPTQ